MRMLCLFSNCDTVVYRWSPRDHCWTSTKNSHYSPDMLVTIALRSISTVKEHWKFTCIRSACSYFDASRHASGKLVSKGITHKVERSYSGANGIFEYVHNIPSNIELHQMSKPSVSRDDSTRTQYLPQQFRPTPTNLLPLQEMLLSSDPVDFTPTDRRQRYKYCLCMHTYIHSHIHYTLACTCTHYHCHTYTHTHTHTTHALSHISIPLDPCV